MTRRMLPSTALGTKVMTADGHKLGIIKEIDGDFFKIARGFLPSYWVAVVYVDAVAQDQVRMQLTKDAIDYAKVDRLRSS